MLKSLSEHKQVDPLISAHFCKLKAISRFFFEKLSSELI